MALSSELTARLLDAIESDTLVFLCGAGLSMPSPSDLPSAAEVAQTCYDRRNPVAALPAELRNDIDKLAGYFYTNNEFEPIFINGLVPWNDLVGTPNCGHAAIADFLICRAARAAMSANFDPLIEHWAEEHKIALQGALTGQEAVAFTTNANPLLKFHGCLHRDKKSTLWTREQLTALPVETRIESCSKWMNLHLPGTDLLVLGFWTDWGYLNSVLAEALAVDNANSVTVIDPCSSEELQSKAPELWEKLTNLSKVFEHVPMSAADALDELRVAFSKSWARRFYALGAPSIVATGKPVPPAATPDDLTCEDLYNLRRDAEGIPFNRAARQKEPAQNSAQCAYTHMLILNSGADKVGAWFQRDGRSIRVINGAGQGISDVRGRYREPVTTQQADIVVCAGSHELGVPVRVISGGSGASVVRPQPGGSATWLTLDQARQEFDLD